MSHYFPEFFFQKEAQPSHTNTMPINDDFEDQFFEDLVSSLKSDFPRVLMRSRQNAHDPLLSFDSVRTTGSLCDAYLALAEEGSGGQKKLVEIDGHELDFEKSVDLDNFSMGSLLDDDDLDPMDIPVVISAPAAAVPKKESCRDNDVAPEERQYTTPTDSDVCLGRGGWTNKHPGNLRFHEWKKLLMHDYFAIEKKLDRTPVAQRLLDLVYQHNGRFLNKDKKGWYEIGTKKAREKCSQALRDSKITAEDRARKRQMYPKKKTSGKK